VGELKSPSASVLYKYVPPERIDILESMELRFSPPSEFNDQFDTHFLLPKDKRSSGIAARFKLRARLGVLCLTERPDNHLMWVNYARNHTGFVLGFDANAPFFTRTRRFFEKSFTRIIPSF